MASYGRSPSPSDRGLHTSHRTLHHMKHMHTTPLRTVPGTGASPPYGGEGGDYGPGSAGGGGGGGLPHGGARGRSGSPDTGRTRLNFDGLHDSHRGFSAEKAHHDTGILSKPRGRGPPSVSPARQQDLPTPWAPLNAPNPSQFRDPLPPTRYGDAPHIPAGPRHRHHHHRQPALHNNPRYGGGGGGGGGGRIDDPVYEWQARGGAEPPIGGSRGPPSPLEPRHASSQPASSSLSASPAPQVQVHFDPLGVGAGADDTTAFARGLRAPLYAEGDGGSAHRRRDPSPASAVHPVVTSVTLNEDVRRGGSVGPPRPAYVHNLSGNWVVRPGGDEQLRVTHDQTQDRLVGVGVRAAEWSEVQEGQAVDGRIVSADGVPQVELYKGTRPVMRLYPELQADGRLLLLPSRGTVGTEGYWEVLPQNVHGGSTPLHEAQQKLEISYEIDNELLVGPRSDGGNATINIFS